jgi:hypothetical protein
MRATGDSRWSSTKERLVAKKAAKKSAKGAKGKKKGKKKGGT